MKNQVLAYQSSSIHYSVSGNGGKNVICFHGYGESTNNYDFLPAPAGAAFSFISLDLPFHGKTVWAEKRPLTPGDLVQIVEKILFENRAPDAGENDRIILVGFSLGARMALRYYQERPERVEKLILLAPDGLKVNFWYWLATQTGAGNKFFAFTMEKPGWFFGMLKLMKKLQLVNPSIFKFVNYYIGNPEVRSLLYNRWTVLRKIKPSVSQIKKAIREHKTAVRLIYGKYDRIILSSVGEKFRAGIREYCTLTVINSGHQVLHEKNLEAIISALQH
ncbi:MAG: alpha/beta hydrolase [Sphingobacteriales bacterium]|nr:alpha/beta hydrolase [Sphingobacteriales bacterium]